VSSHEIKHCSQIVEMVALVATFGCNVVDVTLHCLSQVIAEDCAHYTLVDGTRIL